MAWGRGAPCACALAGAWTRKTLVMALRQALQRARLASDLASSFCTEGCGIQLSRLLKSGVAWQQAVFQAERWSLSRVQHVLSELQ